MVENGVYVISDRFYDDFPDPYLKGNKQETRPHFYALRDDLTGLFWMVPMSGDAGKYETIINRRKKEHKPTDFLYVAAVGLKKKSAFLIGDMFPVTEEYVTRPYTTNGRAFIVSNKSVSSAIKRKSKRVLNLLRQGISFTPTQPDVLLIEASLILRSIQRSSPLNLTETDLFKLIIKDLEVQASKLKKKFS